MITNVDIGIVICTMLDLITEQFELLNIFIIVYIDLYSLYKCLVKLNTIKKKRLIIDIIVLKQSYERRELSKVRLINNHDNPADTITKTSPNKVLEKLIDCNSLVIQVKG